MSSQDLMTRPDDPAFHPLRALAAGKGQPITGLGDKAPFTISCRPMSEDWKQAFDERHPTTDVLPANLEGSVPKDVRQFVYEMRRGLRDGLLEFGGERVCLPAWDPDLHNLLGRGQLFSPEGAKTYRGEIGRCHANASLKWLKNPERYLLATGYYLPSDGMWRQHSWCLEIMTRKAPRILEGSDLAVAYFGFVMTKDEASIFAEANAV